MHSDCLKEVTFIATANQRALFQHRSKINEKEAGVGSFKKYDIKIITRSNSFLIIFYDFEWIEKRKLSKLKSYVVLKCHTERCFE